MSGCVSTVSTVSTESTGAGVGYYPLASSDDGQDSVTHSQSGSCPPFSETSRARVASWRAGVHDAGNDTPEPATFTHVDRNASSSLAASALELAKGIAKFGEDAERKTALDRWLPSLSATDPLATYLKQTALGDIRVRRKSFNSVIGSIDGSADVVIVVSPAGDVLGVFTKEEHGQWMMRNVGDGPDDPCVECKPSQFLQRFSSPNSYGLRVKVIEGVHFTAVQPEEREEHPRHLRARL